MQIIRSVFSKVFGNTIPDTNWVLAEGIWYDNGQWIDTAAWNDGV